MQTDSASVTFLWYPRCSTCKKAKAWLDMHKVDYKLRDIVEQNPTPEELSLWFACSSYDNPRRLCNTSGVLYRQMNLKAQLDAGMSTHELFELMGTEGKLVKRPLLVVRCDEKITAVCAGFREEEWTGALNL